MEKSNINEIKQKLVREEITLEEYNRLTGLLEEKSEQDEISTKKNEDTPDEAKQEADTRKDNLEGEMEHQNACNCDEKNNERWLYAILGILITLVIASILTNGFGLK